MGLDPLSPVAPACVKALVLPVGQVRQSRFTGFVERLQKENVVRLGDVSPDGRPNRTMFSPLAFPDGLVFYNISSSSPPSSHLELAPFELYRLPLLVIGILDGRQALQDGYDEMAKTHNGGGSQIELASQSLEMIKEDHPLAMVHRIIVFDGTETLAAALEGIISVPPPAKSRTTTMKTVMCDMTSALLGEMTSYAKSIQERNSIETPREASSFVANVTASAIPPHMAGSSRPVSFGPGSRSSSPTVDARLGHRMSMPAHVSSMVESRSSTPDGRVMSPPPGRRTPPSKLEQPNENSQTTSPPRNSSREGARPGSQERISTNGFVPGSVSERERNRGKARVGVIVGALYLLAGRWPDALKELSNSAATARANSDYVWQAKAMDYLLVCLLMSAWAGMDFRIPDVLRPASERPSSSKNSKHSPSNSQHEFTLSTSVDKEKRAAIFQTLVSIIPDAVNNILSLYGRAYTFTDDKIPSLSFSDSSIRCAKLLTIICVSKGCINEESLIQIVRGGRPVPVSGINDERNFAQSKPHIVMLLLRAYPGPAVEPTQSISERVKVLAEIAAVLSDLGYHRKQAIVLKDIISTILPALIQARKEGAAEMGVHPAASLASLNAAPSDSFTEPFDTESEDMEHGMRSFLHLVCQSYGIVRQSHGSDSRVSNYKNESSSPISTASIAATLHQAISNEYGPQELKVDILRTCINICEALPDLAGALQYSTLLLRTAGSGVAPGPESSNGSPDLAVEEQIRIANNISRTLSAAQHLGLRHPEADYWDEFLVRGIEVLGCSQARRLNLHARSELDIAQGLEGKKKKNPFIYNPFLNAKTVLARPTLVASEEVVFQLMLQNLFDFDIMIDSIVLESDGVPLMCSSQAVMIGPYRTQTMRITAIPQEKGSLTITSYRAKIRGCRARSFLLYTEAWAFKADVKGRKLLVQDIKTSTDSPSTEGQTHKSKPAHSKPGPTPDTLKLDVIDSQPLLTLKSLSLPQSAIMLLEGEKKTFELTLHNISVVTPADFVLLSFADPTNAHIQEAFTSKELSVSDLYELELSAAYQPSLKWKSSEDSQDLIVNPRGDIDLGIEIYGKRGLTHGKLQIDYGFLGVPKTEIKDRFFTRQITVPINITVNASLDLVSNDILPLLDLDGASSTSLQQNTNARGESLPVSMRNFPFNAWNHFNVFDQSKPHCLLLADFRNICTSTLTLQLCAQAPTIKSIEESNLLQQKMHTGTTSRIPIPIPRIYLPTSQSHAPIPSLNPANKRQFVVSATKTSPEAERAAREAFWYREEILKLFSATWIEDSTGRTGIVNLRTLQLTPQMISVYKLDDVAIDMSVSPAHMKGDGQDLVAQLGPSTYQVPTSTFLTITTTLYNRSSSPIRPLLRLQPNLANQSQDTALDLSKKLLINGVLQRALSALNPGEERRVDTIFVVLSRGMYEWKATVEEIVGERQRGEGNERKAGRERTRTGEMDLRVEEQGRRIWHGERPCVVIARDGMERGKGVDGDENEESKE